MKTDGIDKVVRRKYAIPDAINQSITKEFTQVPNELLRNPNISFKAKGILCLLLSNKEGWHSYIATIKKMTKEGDDAIRSGIAELEQAGYLLRVQYREKKTKIRRGSFWAYTDIPNNFNMEETVKMLEERGMECFVYQKKDEENLDMENPDIDTPEIGNPRLKILINKNIKNKNTNIYLSGPEKPNSNSSSHRTNKSSIQERNKKYLPLSSKLANIVCSYKNIRVNLHKVKSWANSIRAMTETDGIDYERIETALDWYQKNVGGEYVPIIESGASLRNKFIRLEEAIKRGSRKSSSRKGRNAQGISNEHNYAAQEMSAVTMQKPKPWGAPINLRKE